MKELKAIPIAELIKKAGSKRRVAQIAGIQNLGSLSHESVLIGDRMYRPSISTADWAKVSKELVGDDEDKQRIESANRLDNEPLKRWKE